MRDWQQTTLRVVLSIVTQLHGDILGKVYLHHCIIRRIDSISYVEEPTVGDGKGQHYYLKAIAVHSFF